MLLKAKRQWVDDRYAKLPEETKNLVDKCVDAMCHDKLAGKHKVIELLRDFETSHTVVNWERIALIDLITTMVLLHSFYNNERI
jgi:hypothetical protein